MPRHTHRRLTLVELIVVLLILVILTTVSLRATTSAVEQARFDASRKTLEQVRDAILGPEGATQSDGTPLVTGYVADMGRLPNSLQELIIPGGQPPYMSRASNDDPDVTLVSGWRGPYLRLPIGSDPDDGILDGYGNKIIGLDIADVAEEIPGFSGPIASVAINTNGRAAPFNNNLKTTFKTPATDDSTSTVTIQIKVPDSGSYRDPLPTESFEIQIYLPDRNADNFLDPIEMDPRMTNEQETFEDVPIGPKVVVVKGPIPNPTPNPGDPMFVNGKTVSQFVVGSRSNTTVVVPVLPE